MCGIVGFCWNKNVLNRLLDGLERLEYRGYDSAGIAVLNGGQNPLNPSINCVKTLGRIVKLREKTALTADFGGNIGIGHTRWATHGAVSDKNAHPHLSKNKKFALVHNGIIENYAQIREFLLERCFDFESETDTESMAHLIEYYYQGDVVEALVRATQRLKGSYALAVLCADTPDVLYCLRKDSPLVIGVCDGANDVANDVANGADGGANDGGFGGMLASDMSALLEYTHEFIIPDDGEIALIRADGVRVINFNGEDVEKKRIKADFRRESPQKNGFENYMLKEIFEQPRAVRDTLSSLRNAFGDGVGDGVGGLGGSLGGRGDGVGGLGGSLGGRGDGVGGLGGGRGDGLGGLGDGLGGGLGGRGDGREGGRNDNIIGKSGGFDVINSAKKLHIVGCGSAFYAGLMAKHFIERIARISVECDIASEFRYKNPLIFEDEGVIAISQSGETADTISAVIEAKKHCKTLGVVNVFSSSLARLCDEVVYTLAGAEIAVATTKGYLCQVVALFYLGLQIARRTNPDAMDEIVAYERALDGLSDDIGELLEGKEVFQQLSARFMGATYAFFIGRGIDYCVSLEGALKLKEISYIHAQSYPAGELKHGTISLIEDGSLVVAVCTDFDLMEKTISNINELRSRGAVVLGISCFDEVRGVCDYFVKIKDVATSPLLASVALQLFAYYVALAKACDIDKPRNLAKSVTVE